MAKKKPKTTMKAYTKGIGKRTASPTIEQTESIKATAGRLGVAVPEIKTQQEADFVLDDLRRRERAARRSLPIAEQLKLMEEDRKRKEG